MSTHNIGVYEDLTKISLNYHQISSNTHLIASAGSPSVHLGTKQRVATWLLLILHYEESCLCIILQFFTAEKNDNFQMKKCYIFLNFAQNIDCGYTLEPPHNLWFRAKIRKNCIPL